MFYGAKREKKICSEQLLLRVLAKKTLLLREQIIMYIYTPIQSTTNQLREKIVALSHTQKPLYNVVATVPNAELFLTSSPYPQQRQGGI